MKPIFFIEALVMPIDKNSGMPARSLPICVLHGMKSRVNLSSGSTRLAGCITRD